MCMMACQSSAAALKLTLRTLPSQRILHASHNHVPDIHRASCFMVHGGRTSGWKTTARTMQTLLIILQLTKWQLILAGGGWTIFLVYYTARGR